MKAEELIAAYREGQRGFRCVDLRGVDLRCVDLRGVGLQWADLRGANLRGVDLREADLRGVRMRGVNLRGANLSGTDLHGAGLQWANLRGADLSDTDLHDVDLQGADLREADLQGSDMCDTNLLRTDMRGADLRGANLRDVYLQDVDLAGVRLDNTCLDPMQMGNPDASDYEKYVTRSGQVWCRGYRTRRQPVMKGPDYVDGRWYEALVFSVAGTDCHPGLHVCATAEDAEQWGSQVISVWFREVDLHHAISKDRVRAFWVEGAQEEEDR